MHESKINAPNNGGYCKNIDQFCTLYETMALLHTTVSSKIDAHRYNSLRCSVLSIYTCHTNIISCHGLYWQLRADVGGNNLLCKINTENTVAFMKLLYASELHTHKQKGWTEISGKSEICKASGGSKNTTTTPRICTKYWMMTFRRMLAETPSHQPTENRLTAQHIPFSLVYNGWIAFNAT